MKNIIILIFLTILSCASTVEKANNNPEYIIYADDSLTTSHKILVAAALEEWNAKTADKLQFQIHFVNSSELRELEEVNTVYIYVRDPGVGYSGFTIWNNTRNSAYISIAPGITDDESFKAVLLHELGHAWHLEHYELPNKSIMHPYIYDTSSIECTDLVAFCNEWHCTTDCTIIPDPVEDLTVPDAKKTITEYIGNRISGTCKIKISN